MTFASEIDNSSQVTSFVVVEPGILADDWTLDASLGGGTNVYYHSLYAGDIVSFKVNNSTTFTAATTLTGFGTGPNDKYYFDLSSNRIYGDFTTVLPVSFLSTTSVHIKYRFYASSHEIIHPKDPLDDDSTQVYWYPLLTSNFSFSRSLDQNIRGFVPSFSSSLELINNGGEAYNLLNKSTLSNSFISQYVSAGPRLATNTVRLFTGLCRSTDSNDERINVSFTDNVEMFSENFPHSGGLTRYTLTEFPDLDAAQDQYPIREVYGRVDGVLGVNIDYRKGSSGRNLVWSMCKHYGSDQSNDVLTLTVVANAGTSVTRTYFSSVAGVSVGDNLVNQTAFTNRTMLEVTGVNASLNYLDHTAANGDGSFGGSATLPATGNVYVRDRIGYAYAVNEARTKFIILDRGEHPLRYNTGLTDGRGAVSIDSTDKILKITFTGSGATSDLNNDDYGEWFLYARVYGQRVTATISGSPIDKDSINTGTSSAWYQILYDILINKAGLSESEVSTTLFSALEASGDREADVGLLVPKAIGEEMPTLRDVLSQVLVSSPANLYTDSSGVFNVSKVQPFGTVTETFTKDDIIAGSFSYVEDFTDVATKLYLSYGAAEVSNPINYANAFPNPTEQKTEHTDSLVASIYPGTKSESIYAPLIISSEATNLVNKLGNIYFWPKNIIQFDVSISFIGLNIGDTIEISRNVLPGFYGSDTLRTVKYSIISLNISDSKITIKAWDQKGIERNQGDF